MKAWWEQLQPRERLVLMIGALGALLIGFYLMVWEPLQRDVVQLRNDVDSRLTTRQWMSQAAREVATLGGGGTAAAADSVGQPLLTLVEQTAKQAGLGGSLNRVEPQGRDRARVWLDQASFDAMVQWLAAIGQTHGIVAESVVADPQKTSGIVNARLVLIRGVAS